MHIPVSDPFGIIRDPEMTFLAQALDPVQVQRCFDRHLGQPGNRIKFVKVCAIRVRRYKTGRRCLIEYDVQIGRDRNVTNMTVLGKVRARGIDHTIYRIHTSLWQNGFSDTSQDGISVSEPIGIIHEFQMWLQRKMPGVSLTEVLASSQGISLAGRIAEAAHKLHQAGILISRSHNTSDEMRILRDRVARVVQFKPSWEKRLNHLLDACSRVAARIPPPLPQGIHRDFYPDQVLVDGDRLYILDLDLYCRGDPALDIGNFIGHVTEYSLRNLAGPGALADREQAFEDRFVELAGESTRLRVRLYALLTLIRHIYLSTQFSDRQAYTQAILELCEQRYEYEWLHVREYS